MTTTTMMMMMMMMIPSHKMSLSCQRRPRKVAMRTRVPWKVKNHRQQMSRKKIQTTRI